MALPEVSVSGGAARHPYGFERPEDQERLAAAVAIRDATVANASDLVMYFDPDGTIAWASPATRALFGMEPEALVGLSGLEMIHPEDRERVFVEFASIPGPGDQVRVEFRVVGLDGSIYWVEETATNLVDDPHVGYVVGNLQDITARKRDEEAIRLQSRLLDAAGQAIVAIDLEGAVIYWNAAATRTYGWSAAEAVGRRLEEVIQPVAGWDDESRAVHAQVHGDEAWSGDFWVRRKDGTDIPVMTTTTPVYDDAETQIGTIGVSQDITERKQLELVQAQLSAIVEGSADAILSSTVDGTVRSWNRAAERLYGRSADAMIGTNIDVTVPADRVREMDRHLDDVQRGHPVTGIETVRLHADGTDLSVSISIAPMFDDGVVVGASAIVRDIADQLALRANVEADRRRLADAQRSAHLGSFEMDFGSGTLTWSDELAAILGLAPDVSSSTDAFRARVHPDDRDLVESELSGLERGESVVDITHRIIRPDGEVRWVMARASLAQGGRAHTVSGTLLDVTDRKRLELDLLFQATHDALTGLPNRNLLIDRLDDALDACEPDAVGVGVQLLDVDRFKLINDSLGHDHGDELLVAIADALRAMSAPGQLVARFGSDTFAIVTPNITAADQVRDIADRIRLSFADGVRTFGECFEPTVSIGMVVAAPGDTAVTALRDADTAMYRAKERGRDRAEWFDPSLRRDVVTTFEVERELRAAITDGDLRLVFQPVLDLETNVICSCEALVRWQHPERGELGPDEFIPVAEETGLIVALGVWVLREALANVARWPNAVHVAVNISPRQLAEPDLFAVVRDALSEFGVPPSRLVLEVTETAVIADPTAAARTISGLRSLGVRVLLDDFGTGYTSLSFLRDYHVDGLKIDRSFVNDLGASSVIVDAIIRISSAMGMSVIAEGIETAEQLERLRSLGCRFIQGFLVSRPVPPDQLEFLAPVPSA
jgi:diguanylate cyclase (GGDEF)-like protein/PAS domain S-box-containing protein